MGSLPIWYWFFRWFSVPDRRAPRYINAGGRPTLEKASCQSNQGKNNSEKDPSRHCRFISPRIALPGKTPSINFPFLDQHGAAYSSPLFTKQESEVAARLVQIGIDTQRCPEFNDCALLIANPYERSSEVAMRHG
jgi:hypothetical protein